MKLRRQTKAKVKKTKGNLIIVEFTNKMSISTKVKILICVMILNIYMIITMGLIWQ